MSNRISHPPLMSHYCDESHLNAIYFFCLFIVYTFHVDNKIKSTRRLCLDVGSLGAGRWGLSDLLTVRQSSGIRFV